MIKISRQEADKIREVCPKAHIKIVNRGKPYKKYWAEESRGVLKVLSQISNKKYSYHDYNYMRG